MLSVRPYVPDDAAIWNKLVECSRNGNLLHLRGYMDYHAGRFVDASLLVEHHGELLAVFPANIEGDRVTSHGGLTYAGLIVSHALRAAATLDAFECIGAYYRAQAVTHLRYKAVPHVFHTAPAEEDLYALHRLGARLWRRDLSSVIPLKEPLRLTPERRRSIRRAGQAGLRVRSGGHAADFHALLTHVLARHNTAPAHSLDELQLLQQRFPQRIVLHEALRGDELLAGVVVYDFGHAVHTQYLAVSDQGRQLDALSFLLAGLIGETYAHRTYFSFGVSTEQEGRVLNEGLVEQKERFGARAVVHDFYEWIL